MPSIDLVLGVLRNKRYFCNVDLCQAFLAISLDEASRHLTAFSVRSGQYEYVRMCPGLIHAPSSFNRLFLGNC
jgi:hypothetical protein